MGVSDRLNTRRKLQFAGNSSYVLTLPKRWIVGQKLDNPNSEVMIEELADSTLRISPSDLGESRASEEIYSIKVHPDSQPDEVVRTLLGAYLASYNQIELVSVDKNPIPINISLEIEDIITKLWGSEITAQTATTIKIQDALDPSSMGIKDCIQKAWFTAQNMLDQAFKAIFEEDLNAKKIVDNSENTLDKLYYLALRQLYKASSNYIFASDIGIKPSDIIDYHLLAKNIERIGDHCVSLVQSVGKTFENKEILKDLAERVMEATSIAVNGFLELNEVKAQEAIQDKELIIHEVENIQFTLNEYPIARSLLRMADYSADIGELVINRKVASDSKNN